MEPILIANDVSISMIQSLEIERGQSLRMDPSPIAVNKNNMSRNQTASLTHWSLDKSFIISQKDQPLTEA